jgi:polyribonucleotide nucleotidyltransferase
MVITYINFITIYMFKQTPYTHSIDLNGQKLTLETGLLAKQATSSVLATIGETTVLAAVVVGKESPADYFPLQIIYEERLYAAGKIKGSRFIKREGRPSDASVLAGRMVDRSLRSLFDPYIRNEIQIVITILSVDEVNSPDTLAVLAASTALSLCGIDGFVGPVSSVRVALQDEVYVTNPSYEVQAESDLDLIVSGNGQSIMMVEAGSNIIPEEIIGKGLEVANTTLTTLTQFQKDFVALVPAKTTETKTIAPAQKYVDYFLKYRADWEKTMYVGPIKMSGNEAYNTMKDGLFAEIKGLVGKIKTLEDFENIKQNGTNDEKEILSACDSFDEIAMYSSNLEHALYEGITHIVRDNIISSDKRLDGRRLDETRPISCQIQVLPHTHGSSLFNRGETQVLNVLTIGTNRDAQTLDDMEDFEEQTKRYIHHYNFPAYSVGETGRYFGPGRREIGHGALAEKALLPVLPSEEEFPYTMRLVSECLGSNGSTSMASTCASCLSLLEGGVPIKDLVAGVAMGLMLDVKTGNYKVVTDIQGFEDHHGDMDFKVTGTKDGITALQLDNKVAGLTVEILKDALDKAKAARLHILGIMKETISEPKADISQYAPRVAQIAIPFEKIGEVIGPSGKVIKSIIAKTGVEIEIDDLTGRTLIYGKEMDKVLEAQSIILSLIKEYAPGDIVSGKVYRLEAFGAFVKIDGTEKEGLIHISESSPKGERVKDINDIFKIDDVVSVKILAVNDRGQISCTRKGVE